MPIVSVQLFPGRTAVVKEFLGRAIVDAVSEIAGTSREAVHVIFHDIPKDEWAIGPSLVASKPPPQPTAHVPAFVTVERVRPKSGALDRYVVWRRDSLSPFLASQQGFLSSTLLTAGDAPGELIVIDKWTSPEAQEQSQQRPEAADLRDQAARLVEEARGEINGGVVDVLHGRG